MRDALLGAVAVAGGMGERPDGAEEAPHREPSGRRLQIHEQSDVRLGVVPQAEPRVDRLPVQLWAPQAEGLAAPSPRCRGPVIGFVQDCVRSPTRSPLRQRTLCVLLELKSAKPSSSGATFHIHAIPLGGVSSFPRNWLSRELMSSLASGRL